jgi:predicted acylesterase/phospholipase RssA
MSGTSSGNDAAFAYHAASPYSSSPSVQDNQLAPLALQPEDELVKQTNNQQLKQFGNLYSSSSENAKATFSTQRPREQLRAEPVSSVLRVQTDNDPATARKILCLDGGGVRGLASLMIVKHLMDRLEHQRGGRLEPWQEFDMIAGTSTGGLIAIMLGRLRMSVNDCIEAYQRLSEKIFTPVHSNSNVAGRAVAKFKAEGKFDSEPLETTVKQMCQEHLSSESELMRDDDKDAPKVFVCAVQGSNSDSVVIRSYKNGMGEWDELYPICKIWEAARATSAASTFFDPIKIGHQRYVDGALRHNNPIEKASEESRGRPFYAARRVSLLTRFSRPVAQ